MDLVAKTFGSQGKKNPVKYVISVMASRFFDSAISPIMLNGALIHLIPAISHKVE